MVVTLPFRPDVLQGRHALVCGGSAGIGAAIATTLASCGATVTSIARTEHSLDHLDGDGHQALVSDLEDLEALDDMLGRIHHPIHILINNTGGPPSGPLLEADLATFEPALARLLHAPHHLTRALVPGMEAEGFGRIVNIVSTSVREPIANIGVSNTVRGAVANWAKTLATELAPCITINNILPGFTDTRDLWDSPSNDSNGTARPSTRPIRGGSTKLDPPAHRSDGDRGRRRLPLPTHRRRHSGRESRRRWWQVPIRVRESDARSHGPRSSGSHARPAGWG